MTSQSSLITSPTTSAKFRSTSRSPSTSSNIYKSLEDIQKNLTSLDNFLTITEDILRRERSRDMELYRRERARKERTSESSSAPPLSFKNGKIFCLGDDGTKFNPSNIQLTHEIVKQIINNQNNYLCFENHLPISDDPDPSLSSTLHDVNLSEEKEIFLTHQEDEDDAKLKSFNDLLIEFSPTSTISSKLDEVIIKSSLGDDIPEPDYNRSDTMECMAVAPESPEKSHATLTTSLSQKSSASDRPTSSNRFIRSSFRRLIGRFNDRTKRMRNRLDIPPTPSISGSLGTSTPKHQKVLFSEKKDDDDDVVVIETKKTEKSLAGKQVKELTVEAPKTSGENVERHHNCSIFCCCSGPVLDPQGRFFVSWLFIVTLSFLYNAFVIPLRTSFPFQTPDNSKLWFMMDCAADFIYIVDLLFIKHRIMFLYEGFWIRDRQLTRKNYMRKLQFKLDVISLLPLNLLYIHPYFGTGAVYLRIPRFLKIQSFWEFFKLLDRIIASPHILRVGKTLSYMLYMIHLTACTYYAVSSYKGLGSNRWVFSGKGHPYVRCFAFATKTATSIGKNPKPYEVDEYMFMTCAWLMGVFVFALLIGQIRDIIATATRSQSEYKQLVDETLEYMRRLSLPTEMQRRVKQWFTFTWEQQRSLDETHILDTLPANLKTDIAISVHIQTLSQVQLFAGCDEAFLRELVLKLRSVIFLPNDFVCRKGEVGKEMYIIKTGQIQVLGRNGDEVLATLRTGAWFGEISLLDLGGTQGNRRTADVRSKGFSNLFVLSKSDLQEVIVHYEDARAALENRAKVILKENATRDKKDARNDSSLLTKRRSQHDVVIDNPKTPNQQPKLLDAVIQALPSHSPAVQLLTRGSRRHKKRVGPAPVKLTIENELCKEEACESFSNLTDNEKELLKSARDSITNVKCDVHREMS